MDELIALVEKWQDVLDCADDHVEKTLSAEVIEDLKELKRVMLRG